MFNPFFLMAILFATLAALAAFDSALASWNVLSWFNSLRWLRVHFITLGALVEIAFGVLPGLVAARANQVKPKTRWDIWWLLNGGVIILLSGIPLVNPALIIAGGALVFSAAVLLWTHLRELRSTRINSVGQPFYLAAVGFLLVGIFFGTGLWIGWGEVLRVASPKEAHLHANIWGFTSLVFAGLIFDLYPQFAGRAIAFPRSVRAIFSMFVIGGIALMIAPWIGSNPLMVAGLIAHQLATASVVLNIAIPALRERAVWSAGLVHIVTGYLWIITPMFILPLIVMGNTTRPVALLESGAPSVLVYGWILQIVCALAPYLSARIFNPGVSARLGGNRVSLIAAHLGTALFAAGMLIENWQALLQGFGFFLWAIALAIIVAGLWRVVRANEMK